MNRYTNITLVFVMLSVSCQEPPPPITSQVVPVEGLYQLNIPSYLKPGYDMHAFASLQYYDTERNLYVLGIEDAKENLGDIKRLRLKLKGYFQFVEGTVFGKTDSLLRESSYTSFKEDGFQFRAGDYYAQSKVWGEHPVYYRIAIYENESYFLQLVIWMPYEIHCNEMPWVDSMTYSLRFMDPLEADPVGLR